MSAPIITNNKRQYRFEILLNDDFAFLEYRWLKGSMVLMRTLVPPKFRKQGIGAQLAHYALAYARDHQLKVIIYCPFVEKYIRSHSEFADLIDKSHKR